MLIKRIFPPLADANPDSVCVRLQVVFYHRVHVDADVDVRLRGSRSLRQRQIWRESRSARQFPDSRQRIPTAL